MMWRLVFLAAGLLLGSPAWADYLVLSRPAHVRAEPDGEAPSLYRLDRGVVLLLLEDDQTDRYYHVEPQSGGHAGWVYSTLARRFSGSPPDAVGPVTPSETAPTPPPSGGALNDASAFPIPNCGPQGKSGSPERIKTLNRLKNRLIGPPSGIVRTLTLSAILAKPAANDEDGDADRWSNDDGVEVVGFVTKVKAMQPESCNCDSEDPNWRDVHIELRRGPSDTDLPMVVEVTPQWSHLMSSAGKDWSAGAKEFHPQPTCARTWLDVLRPAALAQCGEHKSRWGGSPEADGVGNSPGHAARGSANAVS